MRAFGSGSALLLLFRYLFELCFLLGVGHIDILLISLRIALEIIEILRLKLGKRRRSVVNVLALFDAIVGLVARVFDPIERRIRLILLTRPALERLDGVHAALCHAAGIFGDVSRMLEFLGHFRLAGELLRDRCAHDDGGAADLSHRRADLNDLLRRRLQLARYLSDDRLLLAAQAVDRKRTIDIDLLRQLELERPELALGIILGVFLDVHVVCGNQAEVARFGQHRQQYTTIIARLGVGYNGFLLLRPLRQQERIAQLILVALTPDEPGDCLAQRARVQRQVEIALDVHLDRANDRLGIFIIIIIIIIRRIWILDLRQLEQNISRRDWTLSGAVGIDQDIGISESFFRIINKSF